MSDEKRIRDAERAKSEAHWEWCFASTVYVVEASSFEVLMLWKENALDSDAAKNPVSWRQLNPGTLRQVGTLDSRPICISCEWVSINGCVVMFYEATSQVVDHAKVDAWLRQILPDVPKTDPMNFQHCLQAIR